jgi:chromosome segregation ATPase
MSDSSSLVAFVVFLLILAAAGVMVAYKFQTVDQKAEDDKAAITAKHKELSDAVGAVGAKIASEITRLTKSGSDVDADLIKKLDAQKTALNASMVTLDGKVKDLEKYDGVSKATLTAITTTVGELSTSLSAVVAFIEEKQKPFNLLRGGEVESLKALDQAVDSQGAEIVALQKKMVRFKFDDASSDPLFCDANGASCKKLAFAAITP